MPVGNTKLKFDEICSNEFDTCVLFGKYLIYSNIPSLRYGL